MILIFSYLTPLIFVICSVGDHKGGPRHKVLMFHPQALLDKGPDMNRKQWGGAGPAYGPPSLPELRSSQEE